MGIRGLFSRPRSKAADGIDVEKFDSELYSSFRKQLWFYHSWGALCLLLLIIVTQIYFIQSLGLQWAQISSSDLLKMNAAYRPLMFAQEPWRLITSLFVHASLLSWLINCMAILSVGALLDRYQGTVRTLWLFFISGLSANLIAAFFQAPGAVWSGATGGIFGLYLGLISISAKVDFRLVRKFDWLILPLFLWDAFSKSTNVPLAFAGSIMGIAFMMVMHREQLASRGARGALLAGWTVFGYLMVDKLLPTLAVTKNEAELEKGQIADQRTHEILRAAKDFLESRENFLSRYQQVLDGSLAISDMQVWMLSDFRSEVKSMRQSLSVLRSPTMKIYLVQKTVFEDLVLLDKICQELSGGFVGDQLPYWQGLSKSLEPSLKNIHSALADAQAAAPRTASSK